MALPEVSETDVAGIVVALPLPVVPFPSLSSSSSSSCEPRADAIGLGTEERSDPFWNIMDLEEAAMEKDIPFLSCNLEDGVGPVDAPEDDDVVVDGKTTFGGGTPNGGGTPTGGMGKLLAAEVGVAER